MARGAFWTIIVDEQPTAFRAPVREDLLPTLKQLQRQHPTAVIKWFQRGRLWDTPGDAMDAGRPPRRGAEWRPGGEHKDPRAQYQVPRDVKRKRWAAQAAVGRGPWVKGADRAPDRAPGARPTGDRPAWRPKPDGDRPTGGDRPRSSRPPGDKPAWRPKPGGDRPTGSDRPRSSRPPGDKPAWGPKAEGSRPPREGKTGWKPSGDARPRGTGPTRDAPRADWRGGERGPRRDAAPRAAGDRPAPATARKKTWRVGEVPPADRKRRKDEKA